MADTQQRTEKPTKRRVEKARKEGQFPVSREMIAAVHYLAFAWILLAWGGPFLSAFRAWTRDLLAAAFHIQLDPHSVVRLYYGLLASVFSPLFLGGAALTGVFLAAQLASTKLGISTQKLAPDWNRLNPITRLRSLAHQNLSSLLYAMLLLPVLGITLYLMARSSIPVFLHLPFYPVESGAALMTSSMTRLLWRSAWVLLCLGLIDFIRQYRRYMANIRMSRQEVREELKQTEGNPEIRARVRRIQRDLARRMMIREIPKATAVVVNPTHYSVAIRYEMESMAAPRVIAKGKNYLARRIREIAAQHSVPVVENQLLAQALYKSTEVGQEIPSHLYRAVAEILAYIFKLLHRRGA